MKNMQVTVNEFKFEYVNSIEDYAGEVLFTLQPKLWDKTNNQRLINIDEDNNEPNTITTNLITLNDYGDSDNPFQTEYDYPTEYINVPVNPIQYSEVLKQADDLPY